MPHHRTSPFVQHFIVAMKVVGALTFALFFLTVVPLNRDASAKAPPFATALFDTSVLATPELNGEAVGTLAAGTQVELTGAASPGYLEVYYADGVGWVPSQYFSLGVRPGIDTAVAVVDTALLEAPMRDAGVVANVPEGAAVILTGASVDGYDAASHEGAGGWIDKWDIAR